MSQILINTKLGVLVVGMLFHLYESQLRTISSVQTAFRPISVYKMADDWLPEVNKTNRLLYYLMPEM